MNLKIVIAVLILALVIGATYFILYVPHPSTVTPVTNSQQASQASTNASAAINQIGSTLDSIASKLG